MNNKRGLKFRVLSTALSTLVVGQLGINIYSNINNPDKYVKVPSSVRLDLYKNELIDGDKSKTDYIKYIDKNLTKENISKVEELDVNLRFAEDLEFLKDFTGLKRLYITNPHLITEEDIDLINSLDLKSVIFNMDYVSADIFSTSSLDISKTDNLVFSFNTMKTEGLKLLLFNKYSDIIEISSSKEEFNNLKKYDAWLNSIMNSLDIKKEDGEKQKLYKISNYICQRYDYDFRSDHEESEYNQLVFVRNMYPISSIIDDEKAICINYSTLLSILCIKNNINCINQFGIADGESHAWNKITFEDGTVKYIDLSSFDIVDNYVTLLNYSCSDIDTVREIGEEANELFLLRSKEQIDTLYSPYNEDSIYVNIRDNVNIYNEEEQFNKNKKLYYSLFHVIGGIGGFGVSTFISKKRRKY